MPDSDNEPQALKEVLEGLALSQRPQRTEGAETGDDAPHAFWDTQPVPHAGEDLTTIDVSQMGPIDPADMDAVRKEPYNLPPSFEWSDVDLGDAAQAKELYTLLHENYVEDGDQMFRLLSALLEVGSATTWITHRVDGGGASEPDQEARGIYQLHAGRAHRAWNQGAAPSRARVQRHGQG
jgi:hypothetical protein